MDSINSFKGYGKVDEAEERAFRKKTRRRLIIIAVSAVVLVAVIFGAVAGTVIHKNKNNNTNNAPNNDSPSLSSGIRAICSKTLYPDSCFSSLSSVKTKSNKFDPEEIFKLSLEIAQKELSKISSIPDKLMDRINDKSVKLALKDCKTLFEDALDELNTSIASTQASHSKSKSLTSWLQIDDIKTWLSSALTDLETCLDGLAEQNSSNVLLEMKTWLRNSTEYTSNSLAIVRNIVGLLDELGVPVHRKLLSAAVGYPDWVNSRDRRLLDQNTNAIKPDLTVAKDGTGTHRTIQDAINAVVKKNNMRTVIYVKAGVYLENVVIDKAHWNIYMYGDDSSKTVVSGNLNKIEGTPTFSTASFIVTGKGFVARDIGFKNTAGPEKHQAVALRSGSDQSVFYRCSFDAFQDTLYAHSNRQFYRDCFITGTVDFIFGNAAVVFQSCNIQPRQPLPNQFNTITAQGKKDPGQVTGISIHRCTITPNGQVTAKTYLGRPWKDYSTTVIMGSKIDGVVDPVGWIEWLPNTEPPKTIYYAEHQNTGPGAGQENRVKWAGYRPVITSDEAQKFTVKSFIQGSEWLPQTNVAFDSSL
ncbi:hypothetical protein Scep_024355 [Stephania cephalantha]|uniref:Pectinesterase n=1 Tax=Stephania cephalantha TaxID=152367 RepID=A0AAP0EZ57_9MAGN